MRNVQFGRPLIGEEEKKAVAEVLSGDILVHGSRSKEFEESFIRFIGGGHGVSVSSCTAALHLAYFNMGLEEGDEVIVPAMTHVATVHAVEFCKGVPVFVDAEASTGNIDISKIEERINNRTKAISVVHFLGYPVDMKQIMVLAQKYNLKVIEDCALAVGTRYEDVHAGLHGDYGCFSFYPVKHMTTAEGGMLISKHKDTIDQIRFQKAFGVDRTVSERKVPGIYDVVMLGYNYRMNELQCAIGIEQLKKVKGFLDQRKKNYFTLYNELKELSEIDLFLPGNDVFQNSYYCLNLMLKPPYDQKRFDLISLLNNQGVGTSIHYPKPVSQFTYYKDKYNISSSEFPQANSIGQRTISLPVGPHLQDEDMKYIIKILKQSLTQI